MDWGAVGLVSTALGKRTRHYLVTPDRLPPPGRLRAPSPTSPPTTVPSALEPPKNRRRRQPAPRTRSHCLTPRALSGMGWWIDHGRQEKEIRKLKDPWPGYKFDVF